ncbi:MAG: phosphatidylglycerol lysyltransferase domain-containing protein [Candidatus Omnitrophota bacterium]|nr:DUF2156 domain-containing protein [Candidatus Omnitrophota bacterium]
MKLNPLAPKDKAVFKKYLNFSEHELSAYSFDNIYVWKDLFAISWVVFENALCVFFKDKFGFFLYLPPLTEKFSDGLAEEVFEILDRLNSKSGLTRIENVEARSLEFYRGLGYDCVEKFPEYLYRRNDLVDLRGNSFKSKRSEFNYFIKNHSFKYLPFKSIYQSQCLQLYNRWMKNRIEQNRDNIYQGLLQDSRICLKTILSAYKYLNIIGRVVEVEGRVKAFTFGFVLNKDTFCVSYEITDLSVKGLSQFIFREFVAEMKEYQYINIMDDSGLENLKRVKLSYRPVKLVPSHIIRRSHD